MRRDGLLDEPAARRLAARVSEGEPIVAALSAESDLSADAARGYLADLLGMDRVDLRSRPPSPEVVGQFPARILLTYGLLPLERSNGCVRVATASPLDLPGVDELRMVSGCDVEPVLADGEQIARCLNALLGVGAETMEVLVSEAGREGVTFHPPEDVDLDAAAEDASIITFVNQVLLQAIERRATDVHIEPFEGSLRVRFRVDGVLQETPVPREVHQFHPAIVSRIKILANLDIAEKRVPQDGRVKLRIRGTEVDVRVSVIPMLHGEAVVLRLLDCSSPLLGLEHLGMSDEDRNTLAGVLELPHGIVLVTGPTGSGKTTTLYACLAQINDIQRKIVTIEDPIEYHLHGINQIQVATRAGLTFARGLRSVLRHDPDVLLVGEIRDRETAEIAVQASLTGHLVFSTLHTNDAPGAAIRLIDMGVEPYLVASSVEVVMAQRLVRTLCPACRTEARAENRAELEDRIGGELPSTLARGAGCDACGQTGYQGRIGIFEILPVSECVREIILRHASASDIRRQGIAEGMRSLRQDGLRLIRQGVTTVEEVLRVSKDEVRETGP
jgi:general secretion pathway protein E/type IV pilus assembly protein PilB